LRAFTVGQLTLSEGVLTLEPCTGLGQLRGALAPIGANNMTWKLRGLVAAVIAVLLAACAPMEPKQAKQSGTIRAQAAPVSFTDPDDVNLPLDLNDAKETELGAARVSRIGAHALRVSFSRRFIGAAEYQYQTIAGNDVNGNEEDDPGETDVAPDTGFQPHRL
jgi:hypothetical protein